MPLVREPGTVEKGFGIFEEGTRSLSGGDPEEETEIFEEETAYL